MSNDNPKVMVNGIEILDLFQVLAKDAGEKGKNRAYFKGVRDCYNAVKGMIEYELTKTKGEDEKEGK